MDSEPRAYDGYIFPCTLKVPSAVAPLVDDAIAYLLGCWGIELLLRPPACTSHTPIGVPTDRGWATICEDCGLTLTLDPLTNEPRFRPLLPDT